MKSGRFNMRQKIQDAAFFRTPLQQFIHSAVSQICRSAACPASFAHSSSVHISDGFLRPFRTMQDRSFNRNILGRKQRFNLSFEIPSAPPLHENLQQLGTSPQCGLQAQTVADPCRNHTISIRIGAAPVIFRKGQPQIIVSVCAAEIQMFLYRFRVDRSIQPIILLQIKYEFTVKPFQHHFQVGSPTAVIFGAERLKLIRVGILAICNQIPLERAIRPELLQGN